MFCPVCIGQVRRGANPGVVQSSSLQTYTAEIETGTLITIQGRSSRRFALCQLQYRIWK